MCVTPDVCEWIQAESSFGFLEKQANTLADKRQTPAQNTVQ